MSIEETLIKGHIGPIPMWAIAGSGVVIVYELYKRSKSSSTASASTQTGAESPYDSGYSAGFGNGYTSGNSGVTSGSGGGGTDSGIPSGVQSDLDSIASGQSGLLSALQALTANAATAASTAPTPTANVSTVASRKAANGGIDIASVNVPQTQAHFQSYLKQLASLSKQIDAASGSNKSKLEKNYTDIKSNADHLYNILAATGNKPSVKATLYKPAAKSAAKPAPKATPKAIVANGRTAAPAKPAPKKPAPKPRPVNKK